MLTNAFFHKAAKVSLLHANYNLLDARKFKDQRLGRRDLKLIDKLKLRVEFVIRFHTQYQFDSDSVWLTQEQLVFLFERDQSVISRHIRNVFKEGELDAKSNMQKMHIAKSDKPVTAYNLDVIISVG